jgi:hypothetical protein
MAKTLTLRDWSWAKIGLRKFEILNIGNCLLATEISDLVV